MKDDDQRTQLEKIMWDLGMAALMSCLAMVLLFWLAGCASPTLTAQLNNTAVYRYDLGLTLNGVSFQGVGVLKNAPNYNFQISSRSDVDMFTVTSCHRDFTVESAIAQGWIKKNRSYNYTYTPMPGIEDAGSCLIHVGAYNKTTGQDGWGLFDIETPDFTLPAQATCNGQINDSGGASICQSRFGLIEKVTFKVPVKFDQRLCKIPFVSNDSLTFSYTVPLGVEVCAFKELNGSGFHRHTSVGYDSVLIRGE